MGSEPPRDFIDTFAASALPAVEEMLAWYESQQVPQVGTRLAAEMVQRAEGLVDNPDIGRVVPEFGQPYLRELIHPPYRIVYKREQTKARIVRVWRSERLLAVSDE